MPSDASEYQQLSAPQSTLKSEATDESTCTPDTIRSPIWTGGSGCYVGPDASPPRAARGAGVPNQPKTPLKRLRCDEALWDRFGELAEPVAGAAAVSTSPAVPTTALAV